MAGNVQELRPKTPDSEKITINLGYVDLGQIDLLVQEGFYSNRTDFIRTAIRNQLERHADAVRAVGGAPDPRPRPAPLQPRGPRGGPRRRARRCTSTCWASPASPTTSRPSWRAPRSPRSRARRAARQPGGQGRPGRPHALTPPAARAAARPPTLPPAIARTDQTPARGSRLVPNRDARHEPDAAYSTPTCSRRPASPAPAGSPRPRRSCRACSGGAAPLAPRRRDAAGRAPQHHRRHGRADRRSTEPPAVLAPARRSAGRRRPERRAGRSCPRRCAASSIRLGHGGAPRPGRRGLARPGAAPGLVPDGAQFVAGSSNERRHAAPTSSTSPAATAAQPRARWSSCCTAAPSRPDDFAAGTRMNALAEEQHLPGRLPGADRAANPQRCWNWFSAERPAARRGEPSLIAGITRQVMRDYAVDPRRGLRRRALGRRRRGGDHGRRPTPTSYAAVGVHSGLACGAASDMPSAFAAMRQGGGAAPAVRPGTRLVPTIVFHGDRDTTVHPRNGDAVVAQARGGRAGSARRRCSTARLPAGTPTPAPCTPTRTGRRCSSMGGRTAPATPGRAAARPAPTPTRSGPGRHARDAALLPRAPASRGRAARPLAGRASSRGNGRGPATSS